MSVELCLFCTSCGNAELTAIMGFRGCGFKCDKCYKYYTYEDVGFESDKYHAGSKTHYLCCPSCQNTSFKDEKNTYDFETLFKCDGCGEHINLEFMNFIDTESTLRG